MHAQPSACKKETSSVTDEGGNDNERRDRVRPLPFEDSAWLDESTTRPFALAELSRRIVRPDLFPRDRKARIQVAARLLVLLGVSAVAAVVVGPRLVSADIPTGEDALGTVARKHVRADRDYDLVDAETTAALRNRARRTSRSVWDLDLPRAEVDARVVGVELARLQRAVEAYRQRIASDDTPDGEEHPPLPDGIEEELLRVRAVVAGELSLLGLEAPSDAAWSALVAAAWVRSDVSTQVAQVLERGLREPVVGDRGLLDLDDSRGIVVRTLSQDGEPRERVIEDLSQVADKQAAADALKAHVQELLSTEVRHLSAEQRDAIADWVGAMMRTTLTYNAEQSEARRQLAARAVPDQTLRVRRGETVVFQGEVISPRHLLVLSAMEEQQGNARRLRAAVGTGAFVLLLCLVVYMFGARGVFRRTTQVKDLLLVGLVLISMLLMLLAAEAMTGPLHAWFDVIPAKALLYAVPIAWGAMQIRFVLHADIALLLGLVAALLGGIMTEPGLVWTVVAVVSSMAGTAGVRRITHRYELLLAGLAAGLVGAGAAVTMELFRGTLVGFDLVVLASATLVGGLVSGFLVAIMTPLIESAFGYVTDLRLLALADLNQPLLKELIVHAPGTWHHSMRVGRLAEDAARAVDANPLLARVMSLYHDVGKIRRPEYYHENQKTNDNPHRALDPLASSDILKEHVSVGLELARQHRIPAQVSCVIDEHHGDNLIEYFYARARSAKEATDVDESAFRYGGRPPQTPETAIVMLADQMEAASRSLREMTSDRLRDVVDHFINRAVVEAALRDCDLSLRDLEKLRDVFWRSLCRLHAPELDERPNAEIQRQSSHAPLVAEAKVTPIDRGREGKDRGKTA